MAKIFFIFLFFLIFCPFRATPSAYGSSQAWGLIGATVASLCQSHQHQIQAATYTTAHSNTRSLSHWARPGIEPTPLWFLVGFVSPVPRWEFLLIYFYLKYSWFTVLGQCLLCSKVIQLYIHIYSFLCSFPKCACFSIFKMKESMRLEGWRLSGT